MKARAGVAIGRRDRWLDELVHVTVVGYPNAPADRPRELAAFLSSCATLTRAFVRSSANGRPLHIAHWLGAPARMGERRWPVAEVDTVADLGQLFGVAIGQLRWLADTRGQERTVTDERLRHYRYRASPKRSGGTRLIESPKPRLKLIQRVILTEILNAVPVHEAAKGFHPGGSVVGFTKPHVAQPVVVHFDLRDFFSSVGAGRVYAIFRRCGYAESVAYALTGLVSNAVPAGVLETMFPNAEERASSRAQLQHLARAHLPQGAPTSPALANLAANGLDRRLAGYARRAGLVYTRYADDLAFSGRRNLAADVLASKVDAIVRDEGFRLRDSKTSIRRADQRQLLAGIVVNARPNLIRSEFDQLKAMIHNAATLGPAAANRDGHPDFRNHLLGRIGWVGQLNATRSQRLRREFDRIEWV